MAGIICEALQRGRRAGAGANSVIRRGRVVQVEPIKPTSTAPGTKCLKLNYDELLSNFAFNFDLRRYTGARLADSEKEEFQGVIDSVLSVPDEV